MEIPVVTIDGPSGSGKGTIARLLADELGWHLLDSGALYRVLAFVATQAGLSIDEVSPELIDLAESLPVSFETVDGSTHAHLLDIDGDIKTGRGRDVERAIRSETAGNAASKVAAMPEVRAALLRRQRDFAQPPGLVADGRDMGTMVFPAAQAKIFLTASIEDRARRRYKQLKEKGIDAKFAALSREISERDERDMNRAASPTRPAEDALLLDSSGLTIEEALNRAREFLETKGL